MGLTVMDISISKMNLDSEFNCRGDLPPIEVMDMVKDLERNGQIQPVVIMKYAEPVKGFEYLLLVGYRRTTAAKILGWETISAVIKGEMGEVEARYMNLRENVQRKDLTIIQEAKAIEKLKKLQITKSAIAKQLGKSVPWVDVRYMLLELPSEIQKEVSAGLINQRQIKELHRILGRKGKEEAFKAVRKIKDAFYQGEKSFTVSTAVINPDKKLIRKRPEVASMLSHIRVNVGNGLATRALAWCAGEISSNELYETIRENCKDTYIPREI